MNKIFQWIFLGMAYSNNLLVAGSSSEVLNLSSNEIDHIVNDTLQTFHVPGAAISLVIDGEVMFSQGYGTRNVNTDLPVTEETLFPIASCTKAFTAFILGQLVDEGKIGLDDLVRKYLPEFSILNQKTTAQLTIRDLLAHRTGMARHDALWVFSNVSQPNVINALQHLEPACALRQEFQYNNFMYTIAGKIIETVTGQTWEEVLAQQLLKPLEMKNSNASLQQLQMSSDYSLPHAEVNGIVQSLSFRNLFPVNPGGGINSNILDMTKWVRLHLSQERTSNQNIIQYQTLKELHTIQISFPPSSKQEDFQQLGYGLGWLIGKYRGYDSVSHGGDIDGFSSEVFLLPNEKIGLVILTNSSSDGRYATLCIRNQIIDKILGINPIDWKAKAQETQHQNKQSVQTALQAFYQQEEKISLGLMKDYVGDYEHPAYGAVKIKIKDEQLIFSYGSLITPLRYKSEDIFSCQSEFLLNYGINPVMNVTFLRDASGNVEKIEVPFEGFRLATPITFVRKPEHVHK